MRSLRSALVVLFIGLVMAGYADADSIATERRVLDNGLTVLTKEIPSSSVIAIYALVKTGSATEGKYLGSGISHFVEHMLFKGTDRRKVGGLSAEVMALGGEINATTGFDYTMYTIELPAGTFDKGLDIMADLLTHSKFDAQEIEKERSVIFGEMRLNDDSPDRRLGELVFEHSFVRHPYQYPIIGQKSLFAKITRDDLWNYYKTTYIPNNMILVVAGAVNEAEALPKIEKIFKDFQPQPYLSRNLPSEPDQIAPRFYEEEYPTELTRMALSFQGVNLLNKDMFALDVLAMILGQGESSRLYLEVYKKKGLVQAISASNYTPMDQGIFEVTSILEPQKIETARQAIWQEINRVKTQGVAIQELEKIKRQVLSQNIFGRQTAGEVAYDLATSEVLTKDPDFSDKYLQGIRSVTAQDIQRVAQQYLKEERLSQVILRPLSTQKEKIAEKLQATGKIQKIILDNGLTVLLKEDHTFKIVDVTLALQGGIRQETSINNGIFSILADVWVRGTKTRSAQQIAESVESLGGGLEGFSGRNSFGIKMSVLSQDLDFGLQLLEDLVKNPSFADEELKKEKEEMQTAILRRDDNISAVTSKALREELFLPHPSGLDLLGSLESVSRIQRTEVVKIYNSYAVANNMVLSIFGDFDSAQISDMIRKKFSSLKKAEVPFKEYPQPPAQYREKNIRMNKQQAMIMIGFTGCRIQDQDRYGLELLSSVLGSSFSGRIFNNIREQLGGAYTLGGGFIPGVDPGLVYFYVLTSDEQAQKVKDILTRQITEIQNTAIPNEELALNKNYLIGNFKMGLETNAALEFTSTLDELYGLGFDHYKGFEGKINAISQADLLRLAKKYLDLSKAAVVITRPSGAVAQEKSEEGAPLDTAAPGVIH